MLIHRRFGPASPNPLHSLALRGHHSSQSSTPGMRPPIERRMSTHPSLILQDHLWPAVFVMYMALLPPSLQFLLWELASIGNIVPWTITNIPLCWNSLSILEPHPNFLNKIFTVTHWSSGHTELLFEFVFEQLTVLCVCVPTSQDRQQTFVGVTNHIKWLYQEGMQVSSLISLVYWNPLDSSSSNIFQQSGMWGALPTHQWQLPDHQPHRN